MGRPLARSIATAVVAACCIVGSSTWFERLTAPLLAQHAGERMPGPIIEDPPGPYVGHSYVPAPSSVTTGQAQALSTWIVTYTGFTAQAQTAFQAAVDVWASQVASSVPIRVSASWEPLPTGVLGSAGANSIWRDFAGAPVANTWFADAIANKITGTDLDPSEPDIIAKFSSSFTWYYGTDGNAGSNFDLMSVVLHELGHGLGFFGSMTVSTGNGAWGFGSGFPMMYDRFAINSSSQSLLDTTLFPNPSAALAAQLVSGTGVFFTGTNARTANGGSAARLYSPNPWQQGSSYSHLNESTFPSGDSNSLMTPQIGPGEAIHDTGPITRGIFTDIGWGPVSSSCSYALSAGGVNLKHAAAVGGVNVITAAGCAWSATSNAGFASISGAASGTGNGTINYAVSTNNGPARNGTLTIGGQTFTISQAAHAVTGDFSGDRRTDVTVFRPSTGIWYVRNIITGLFEFYQWGLNGDIPVQGDYDGDAKVDSAVFRPSTSIWYIRNSSDGSLAFLQWGLTGDIPVPGDYDGDGKNDAAVFRPSTGIWYVRDLATNTASFYQWGLNGDIPVPGDYDGDGKTDVAVFRPSTGIWYIRNSSAPGAPSFLQWGLTGDIPVPGDYDGDGKFDAAVFRPSTGIWYVRDLVTNTAPFFQWGWNGDIPVSGDFDGDGKTDIAVFRPSTSIWYVRPSSTPGAPGFYQWGATGDIPVVKP